MKRDLNLYRAILVKLEEEGDSTGTYDLKVEGYNMQEIAEHCRLLNETGLVTDYKALYGDNKIVSFGVGTLTSKGHNFLDQLRNDTVWNAIKNGVLGAGKTAGLAILNSVASDYTVRFINDTLKNLFV